MDEFASPPVVRPQHSRLQQYRGFDATLDDTAAVALGEEPLDAPRETQQALECYRNAMTYVLQLAQEPRVEASESLIKSLHFMMTHYDLKNSPRQVATRSHLRS
ncbi:hypothetical protein GCM10027022_10840 [Alpinimonas psychrophila]|uniref:Fic family protein n=1 Tax=Alpinimonas psychrophila TaxID=748908 RepID=A0A7W3JTI9_9MICO|nr:hypothetical protein [Alpinimonas psychrophila]MBA8828910.1 Fic family protein [Alpinimonas psychrophila]